MPCNLMHIYFLVLKKKLPQLNIFPLPHEQIVVKNVSRLCHAKPIVTVNGRYPGPTIYAREGDRVIVNVTNHAQYNISIHWYIHIYIYFMQRAAD